MHERVCCHDEAANHQLPIAAAFWIIQIVSAEECSSLMQNLTQIHCSTRSVILNAMTTQYTCPFKGVYHPHWLVQWSCHCSFLCMPAHSPWLPGYTKVTQIILIILTMVGLFPDRPHCVCSQTCTRMLIAALFIKGKINNANVYQQNWKTSDITIKWNTGPPRKLSVVYNNDSTLLLNENLIFILFKLCLILKCILKILSWG